jgi:hypothetical protein
LFFLASSDHTLDFLQTSNKAIDRMAVSHSLIFDPQNSENLKHSADKAMKGPKSAMSVHLLDGQWPSIFILDHYNLNII